MDVWRVDGMWRMGCFAKKRPEFTLNLQWPQPFRMPKKLTAEKMHDRRDCMALKCTHQAR